MAAQQQSLLNVQSNLANVIKNIESNLITRIDRLENNVIDNIYSSSGQKPEPPTRLPIEARAEELRQRHADKMPAVTGEVLMIIEWELNRVLTADEKNAGFVGGGKLYNTTLAGKATVSYFDTDTMLPYETLEIVNYADYTKLWTSNNGDFQLAGYQYTVENPADGVATTLDFTALEAAFAHVRQYIFVYPGERDLVMEFWDSTESMPAWNELTPSTQTLNRSLEEIWSTLSFNSFLLDSENPGSVDERYVGTADVDVDCVSYKDTMQINIDVPRVARALNISATDLPQLVHGARDLLQGDEVLFILRQQFETPFSQENLNYLNDVFVPATVTVAQNVSSVDWTSVKNYADRDMVSTTSYHVMWKYPDRSYVSAVARYYQDVVDYLQNEGTFVSADLPVAYDTALVISRDESIVAYVNDPSSLTWDQLGPLQKIPFEEAGFGNDVVDAITFTQALDLATGTKPDFYAIHPDTGVVTDVRTGDTSNMFCTNNVIDDSYTVVINWVYDPPVTAATVEFLATLGEKNAQVMPALGIEGAELVFDAVAGASTMTETLRFANREKHFAFLSRYSGNVFAPVVAELGTPTQFGKAINVVITHQNPSDLQAYLQSTASFPDFDEMDEATRTVSEQFGMTAEQTAEETVEGQLQQFGYGDPVEFKYVQK